MTSLIPFSKTLKLGRVIYADKGIIVVNKASGLVCQSERSRRVRLILAKTVQLCLIVISLLTE